MEAYQKVLFVYPENGFYRMKRYMVGDYFGPIDLGLHISVTTMRQKWGRTIRNKKISTSPIFSCTMPSDAICASRINSRNTSVFSASERDIDKDASPNSSHGSGVSKKTRKNEAVLDLWFEIRKGVDELLHDVN